jgi:hypothetical protein
MDMEKIDLVTTWLAVVSIVRKNSRASKGGSFTGETDARHRYDVRVVRRILEKNLSIQGNETEERAIECRFEVFGVWNL